MQPMTSFFASQQHPLLLYFKGIRGSETGVVRSLQLFISAFYRVFEERISLFRYLQTELDLT